jgi:uncharacterized protein (TIGR02246 family)
MDASDLDPSAALPALWQDAWNHHDARALADLVAPEVDFVTVAGVWLQGQDEFLRHHRQLHDTQMRDSVWATAGALYRALGPGLRLAHVEWAITGDRDPDDRPRPPRRGHFTWVLQAGPRWRILAGQNTNLGAQAMHRLRVPTSP